MKKSLFFLIGAAIAVLIGATSCEKDIYQKTELQETFFRIIDETHINTYDQDCIIYEKNREVSFEVKTQFDFPLFAPDDTLRAMPDETLERFLGYGAFSEDDNLFIEEEDASICVTFKFENVNAIVRVCGLLQKSSTPPNNTETEAGSSENLLYCLDDVILKAKVLPMEETPKGPIIRVEYTLKVDNGGGEADLLLASGEQKFLVYK